MSDQQQSPQHLSHSDRIGWESGEQVPIVWPQSNCPSGNFLDDLVENAGAIFPDRMAALQIAREFADSRQEGLQSLAGFVDRLLISAPDAETAGRRLIIIGYLLKRPAAPQSLAELGSILGVGTTRAHQLVSEFRLNAELCSCSANFVQKATQKAA